MSDAGSVGFALYVKVGTTVLVLSFKTVGYGSGATKQITLPMNKSVLKSYSGTRLHLLSKVSLTLHATAKDTAGNKLVVSKKIKLSR